MNRSCPRQVGTKRVVFVYEYRMSNTECRMSKERSSMQRVSRRGSRGGRGSREDGEDQERREGKVVMDGEVRVSEPKSPVWIPLLPPPPLRPLRETLFICVHPCSSVVPHSGCSMLDTRCSCCQAGCFSSIRGSALPSVGHPLCSS